MTKELKPFALNFSNGEKLLTLSTFDKDDVFKIAEIFSKLLTEHGVNNELVYTEVPKEDGV
jgi:hypothetical protein